MRSQKLFASTAGILFTILTLTLCIPPALYAGTANPNSKGWKLLLANKPEDAKNAFLENVNNADGKIAGEACRGLSEAAGFLGDDMETCRNFFKAYQKDSNALFISSTIMKIALFSRTPWGYRIKEGYKVLKQLSNRPGLFAGQLQEDMAERLLNDGKVREATSIIRQMGCILDWQYIGPFDNISHSGYNKTYPPEKEIDFSKSYSGKDGNLAKWRPLVSAPTSAWIFVEDHLAVSNAVNYFYCTVKSPVDQDVVLSFGASGMFKIVLNGVVVLADSMFRNTGCDMFMQKTKLFKGENPLLIKLGHEWGLQSEDGVKLSNFSLRLLDPAGYAPLTSISVSTQPAKPHPGMPGPQKIKPQPIVDSIVSVLENRLKKDPDDIDAGLLLMQFYNGTEMTDEDQNLARAWIVRYPGSALLHSMLRESLWRSKKYTDAQTEAKAAYQASPSNFEAWAGELGSVAETGDAQNILQFIEHSPPNCKASFPAEYQKLKAQIKLENRNAVLESITRLEKNFSTQTLAVSIVASTCIEQGNIIKAKKVIAAHLKHYRTGTSLYQTLAQIALKSGNVFQAAGAIRKGLEYKPIDAEAYFYLAKLALFSKNYPLAKEQVDKALEIMPTGAGLLNLKGSVLETMGEKSGAEQSYSDVITYTNDGFNAWDNLRALNKKPGLDSLAALPSIESAVQAGNRWDKRNFENGAVFSYIDDVFYYPSKCSKERQFLVVYLGTQNAIDVWKEYTCGYNSNFQTCTVARALTVKPDARQVPADINGNQVVFKSLQPGDCIALEWTIKNYYSGEMSKQLWGEQAFQWSSPVFNQQLRFITPCTDTVPYTIYGDSIATASATVGDYRIIKISRPPYGDLVEERYRASDWQKNPKVTYSTFTSWSQIVEWYGSLTAHIEDNTLELQALADSLFAGAASQKEKLIRIHRYITNTIRYSFVPFRQSGWIPQAAHDVVATRIGDCKDMASLGKILFEKAGVHANLVLVNTYLHLYPDHSYIGPDFNHCILSYQLDGATHFVDFTDNDSPLATLPMADQSAVALVIEPGNAGLTLLPLDSAKDRSVSRTIVSKLDEKGILTESMRSVRTGVIASGYRHDYRPESPEKRTLRLHEILAKDYPDITIDTFAITDIDSLCDSVIYYYQYHAKNTVTFSGNTAIFTVKLPDAITAEEYPTAIKRHTPLDVAYSNFGISSQKMRYELALPAGWKPINLPEKVSLSSPYGSYLLSFKLTGSRIICERNAAFTSYKRIETEEYEAFTRFLNAVSKADAVQLIFFTK